MKSQSTPIYTFEEMQEVKEHWKLSVMYHQLIIVALSTVTALLAIKVIWY